VLQSIADETLDAWRFLELAICRYDLSHCGVQVGESDHEFLPAGLVLGSENAKLITVLCVFKKASWMFRDGFVNHEVCCIFSMLKSWKSKLRIHLLRQ
jgi:hypothetical protein